MACKHFQHKCSHKIYPKFIHEMEEKLNSKYALWSIARVLIPIVCIIYYYLTLFWSSNEFEWMTLILYYWQCDHWLLFDDLRLLWKVTLFSVCHCMSVCKCCNRVRVEAFVLLFTHSFWLCVPLWYCVIEFVQKCFHLHRFYIIFILLFCPFLHLKFLFDFSHDTWTYAVATNVHRNIKWKQTLLTQHKANKCGSVGCIDYFIIMNFDAIAFAFPYS